MAGSADLDPQFILQHAGFIRSLARGLLRDEALVDDVVQETLIRALEKGPRRREALTAWLRTVTRNIAFKSYRGTARRQAREQDAARPEQLPATLDLVTRGETLERLTAAVLELPEQAREVILLRYYEGMSHSEIAEKLGIGPGAVRMRVHRAQKALKDSLDRASGGGRGAWMSGLAILAGVRMEDVVAPVETAGAGLSAAAAAWTAAIGLALGALAWFAGPGLASRAGDMLDVRRTAELEGVDPGEPLVGALDRSEREVSEIPLVPLRAGESEAAAGPGGESALEPFPEGNLVGTVLGADDGPVAGARVEAAWGRFSMTYKTTTNEAGRFGLQVPKDVFDDALSGRYPILLGATSTGSAPTRVMAWPQEAAEFRSGSALHPHALLRLRGEGGALVGSLRGADGGIVTNAQIELGERTRFGLSFLGYQSAETENNLAPNLAARVEGGDRLTFKGNKDMRGTLGRHVLDASGHRARLLPARRVRSRPDGTFILRGIEPGTQRIRITAPGHAAWTGFVDVGRGSTTKKRFTLAAESSISGIISREDGLPLRKTLVHALQDAPWTAKTVQMAADGSFAIDGLRPGPVRLVAEERTPTGDTPPRIAEDEFELQAGTEVTRPLVLRETRTRPVRFVLREGGEVRPISGHRLDLRGQHNPLLTVANIVTDEEGRVDVPIDTVVPCHWVLIGGLAEKPAGNPGGRKISSAAPVRVIEPPPLERGRNGVLREAVVELGASELTLTSAVIRVDSEQVDLAARDLVLVPNHDLFTITSKETALPNKRRFENVPPGRYSVLVPYHGLGWLSPASLDVPALRSSGTFDLGTLRLPKLASLELLAATEVKGTRWIDLEIQARQGDREIRVFDGRVEIPGSIPVAPGSYVLRAGRERDPYEREIVVREGQQLDVLWPVD